VSNILPWIILSIALLLGIDLLVSATYAVTRLVYPARASVQHEVNASKQRRLPAWIDLIANWESGLHAAQTLTRFLLAGLVLLAFAPWQKTGIVWLYALGIALLSGWLITLLEALVEARFSREADTWRNRLSPLARAWMLLLSPLLLPLFYMRRGRTEESMTEADLMKLVEAGQEDGVIEQEERRMIVSIFRLGDTLAREIMVPRIDIVALEVNTPLKEAVDTLIRFGHSRIPVFQETIDNILGLLYAKDLLRVWQEGSKVTPLQELLRPAYFVPEAKKVDELLAELQAQRIHMAIVVDEYGGVAGLVTLEDIVEEIVGEIQDEYDQAEEMVYQPISEEEYLFLGRVDLDDFNEIVGSQFPKEEADTLAGLIYNRIGRVPSSGESLQVDDWLLTVEQVSGRRIRKVRVKHLPTTEEAQEEEGNHADR
jgi:putative hemolysin